MIRRPLSFLDRMRFMHRWRRIERAKVLGALEGVRIGFRGWWICRAIVNSLHFFGGGEKRLSKASACREILCDGNIGVSVCNDGEVGGGGRKSLRQSHN
jgi:hypothetical protein